MWIAIGLLAYVLLVFLLIRFFQFVHESDKALKEMTKKQSDRKFSHSRKSN